MERNDMDRSGSDRRGASNDGAALAFAAEVFTVDGGGLDKRSLLAMCRVLRAAAGETGTTALTGSLRAS